MNSPKSPDLDAPCGDNFTFRDFIECSEAWRSTGVENTPAQPETYDALRLLAKFVLDPVASEFGRPTLTYGVASHYLSKSIRKGIAPRLDQHAGYELSSSGNPICDRGGIACDFHVDGVSSLRVAQWIIQHTRFDRLYYYGEDRPIHVSASRTPKGQCVLVKRDGSRSNMIPKVVSTEGFLEMKSFGGGKR